METNKILTNRIGETHIANNGMLMTIVDYRGNRAVDVLFDDNTLVKNKTYKNFKSGIIAHPTIKTPIVSKNMNKRVGQLLGN